MAILVPRHFEPGAGDLFEDRSTLRTHFYLQRWGLVNEWGYGCYLDSAYSPSLLPLSNHLLYPPRDTLLTYL